MVIGKVASHVRNSSLRKIIKLFKEKKEKEDKFGNRRKQLMKFLLLKKYRKNYSVETNARVGRV